MEDQEKQTNEMNEAAENQTSAQEELSEQAQEEKSTGAIIGAIIIVVLLVIGGLLYLGSKTGGDDSQAVEPTPEEIVNEADTVTQSIEAQGTSDEIDAIEKDIQNTNLDNLDVDLGNIEAEIGL